MTWLAQRVLAFGLVSVFLAPTPSVAGEENKPKPLQAEIFGSWSVVCPQKGIKGVGCHISQAVATDPKGKNVLLGISVSLIGASQQTRIDFRLTPAAAHDAGLGLKIDRSSEFRLPISKCDARVCVASAFLDDAMLARFKKGTLCQVAYRLPNKKQVTLPVSLKGFSEAFANLMQRVPTDHGDNNRVNHV